MHVIFVKLIMACSGRRRGLPPVTAVKRAAGRDDATSHSVIDSSRVVLCGGCGCCHWLSPSGRQVSRRIAGGTSLAATGLCPPVTAKLQHKCQEQRSAATERPGDRECQPPLSRETRGSDGEIRARIGQQIWERSTLPQVTGLVPNRAKIVRVFDFMSRTSAPGRIRPRGGGRSWAGRGRASRSPARRAGVCRGVAATAGTGVGRVNGVVAAGCGRARCLGRAIWVRGGWPRPG
jgi:hypothetical protein